MPDKSVTTTSTHGTGSTCVNSFTRLLTETQASPSARRAATRDAYRRDEAACVNWIRHQNTRLDVRIDADAAAVQTRQLARRLIEAARLSRIKSSGVDALMREFSLSSEEGIALMCLAEALLRIPDTATADRLIADKLRRKNWSSHLGRSPSLFVNAASWGLLITGKLVAEHSGLIGQISAAIGAGNVVLVKPAEQTPLVAALAVPLPSITAQVPHPPQSENYSNWLCWYQHWQALQSITRSEAPAARPLQSLIAEPCELLPGPTGERNLLSLVPRGTSALCGGNHHIVIAATGRNIF